MPTFNKKEEVFTTLCEFNVPMVRAAWFIKMTAAYNTAMQDRNKKRQTFDPAIGRTSNTVFSPAI